MTIWLIVCLAMQVAMLVLVVSVTRSRTITHVGALFVIVAVVYHGLTEVVQWLFPGHNERNRSLTRPWHLEAWQAYVTMGIVLFTLAYVTVLVVTKRRSWADTDVDAVTSRMPPWWIWAGLALPAFVLAIRSQGSADIGYAAAGLANQFLELFLVLAGVMVVLRHPRYAYPALIVLTLMLVAGGSRLTVISSLVAMIGAIQLVRRQPFSWRILGAAGTATLALMVLLNDARERVGRHVFVELSTVERVRAVLESGRGIDTKVLLDGFVYRFDGNTYPALMVQGGFGGASPTGIQPLTNIVWLAIPSFLNPDKLSAAIDRRSEEVYMARHFGFPDHIDYLTPTLGSIYGYGGLVGLLVVAPLLGIAFALLDRWLHGRLTVMTIPIVAFASYATVQMERGFSVWILGARGLLVVLLVIAAWSVMIQMERRERARRPISWQRRVESHG